MIAAMTWQQLLSAVLATGLTQAELATLVGSKQVTLSDVLRGVISQPGATVGLRLVSLAKRRGVKVPADIEPTPKRA